MPDKLHKDVTTSDGIHTTIAAVVANAAARTALAWTTADLGKVAYQVDTRALWVLRDNAGFSGVEWFELGTPASLTAQVSTNTTDIGLLSGDVQGLFVTVGGHTTQLSTQSGLIAGNTSAISAKAAVTNTAPADTTKAAAAVGVATDAARADHKHDISTAAPATVGTANTEGSATSLARSDHVHSHGNQAGGALHADVIAGGASGFMSGTQASKLAGIATGAAALTSAAPAQTTKATAVVGVATDAARADHKHDVSTAAVSTIGTTNTEGSATSLARSDHVHSHGNQAGGALHADVIAGGASGFMTGTQATQLAANTTKIGAGAITALNATGGAAADLADAVNARWDPLTSFLQLAHPMPNSATVNTLGTWYTSLVTGSGTSPAKLVGPGFEPVCSHGRASGTTAGSISFAAANGQACISQARAFRMAITSYVLVPTTNWRWWQGLMAGVPSNVDISTITHCVLIGKADGLANVQLVHNDGGGTGVMVDLGANFPASTVNATYRLELVFLAGTYYYTVTRIDTGAVASGSFNTRVPAAGLQWVAGCTNNTDALSCQLVWQGYRCQIAG